MWLVSVTSSGKDCRKLSKYLEPLPERHGGAGLVGKKEE
jgi:hypothetical protein